MFSDNITLHSVEVWTNQKANFFSGKEASLTLTADEVDSLNLDIAFQTRQFGANHSLNSEHKSSPFSCLI